MKTLFFFPLRIILALIFLLFNLSPLFAADVYYLGGSTSDTGGVNQSYPIGERFKDLFDFTSDRPLSDRSGKISGSILTQGEYDKVSGNKSKSFLKNGWDYLTEINLNLQEKLWSNYHLEGEVRLRKTDNPRIEPRRDFRVKQYSLKMANPENLFILGDFYGELSPFTLGSSLEGFIAETSPFDFLSMKQIIARKYDADEAASRFQRNVFGTKFDAVLFKDSEVFSHFRMGLQAVTTQDDSSTADRTASFVDLKNSVFSFDGDIAFVKYFSMNYEFARSLYLADEDATGSKDQRDGNAIHIAPQLQIGNTIIRQVYNYTQPQFYTDSGSAAPDKIQHLTTIDHRFNERASVSLMENYYWDHLTGSSLTKRTINDEKSIAFNFLPFADRKSFRTRMNISYNLRNSDDVGNSLESRTFTLGFGVNDKWKGADLGLNYEYRSFSNRADKSLSDYYNRFGFSVAREYSVLMRRLYLSLNPSVDIRRTKTDTNSDLNLSLAFSGQYDVTKSLLTRFGYNVLDSNSAQPDKDYLNNRTFWEFDWTPAKNKNMHVVLRGDLNRYMHEDGTLNYKETQSVIKCVYNF